jgi:hypothetical protein
MRELFIYYRVRDADAAAAREAVAAMHRQLRRSWPGLHARLMTRQGIDGDTQTWMETYSLADDGRGIDAGTESAIEAHAVSLAHFIDGPRHVEGFEPDVGA